MTSDQPQLDSLGSQAERTALAWNRTLFAVAAVTAFIAIHVAAIDGRPAAAVIGLPLALAVAVSASWVSRRVWARSMTALAGAARAVRPGSMAAASAVTVVLAVVALTTIGRAMP
jgi:cytochrome c biogenesis protein ResB